MRYRNAASAFIGELSQVDAKGQNVAVRGAGTRELLSRTLTIERPMERFITIPGRRNDPFATIAESMWVIAGRDDVSFLSRYLPRAPRFSDDGIHWRGAYGPRLRDWSGVDQVNEVRKLLLEDPLTRRAVVSIFDPARDYVETRDVPCNNWLHFVQRDGALHLNVVVRSNDLIWGFSGINTFEWSVLHEMMAHWVGADVGPVTFFVSSLHYYDERTPQVKASLAGYSGRAGYENGWVGARFTTPWQELSGILHEWFEIEARLAAGSEVQADILSFPDPLLRDFLRALRVKWASHRGASETTLRAMVEELGKSDIAFALHELLFRDSLSLPRSDRAESSTEGLREAVTDLHRSKDASYGSAWKRRGEQVSIMANLARKADRLENVAGGAPTGAESLLDTAVDLAVYALKYETFLADENENIARALFGESVVGPYSDGPAGFELLIASRSFDVQHGTVSEEVPHVVELFSRLDLLVRASATSVDAKEVAARSLSDAAIRLLLAAAQELPDPVSAIRREIGS